MEAYLLNLAGWQVTRFVTKMKKGGDPEHILLELHLFKRGQNTVVTVEEYSDYPSCRWIDEKLIVLGHLASLMKEVVKTERVELDFITEAESTHGNFQPSTNANKWIAFTYIVLKWKNHKVYLGDVQSDSVLTTGFWLSPVP